MQNPFPPHAQFFTSLKHLEKRLKLENHGSAGPSTFPPPPPPIERQEIINSTQQTDSLGTPIYLYTQSATINTNSSNFLESEAPQEFLSRSPPANHDEAEVGNRVDRPERLDLDGDVGALMQLLRLSEVKEKAGGDDAGCECDDDEFFERIVAVKGPKNAKELRRLEGWIKHFLKGGERREPFRLVHLLLGKAALIQSDDGFGGLVFPSTINEFLQVDPPMD